MTKYNTEVRCFYTHSISVLGFLSLILNLLLFFISFLVCFIFIWMRCLMCVSACTRTFVDCILLCFSSSFFLGGELFFFCSFGHFDYPFQARTLLTNIKCVEIRLHTSMYFIMWMYVKENTVYSIKNTLRLNKMILSNIKCCKM